jgi:antigen flippase
MSRDVLFTLSTRLVTVAAGFVISVVTARYIGPEGRGQYYLVITLSAFVVQFGNLGLHASNTYRVAANSRLFPALLGNSVWAAGVLGACGGASLVALLTWTGAVGPPLSTLWFAAALSIPLLFWLLGTSLLVGIDRIGAFNVLEAGARVLALLLTIGAGWLGFGVNGFLAAYLIATTLGAAILLLLLLRLSPAPPRLDRGIFASGLRYALKAYLIAVLGFLVLRSNVFLIERISGSTELGYFSVAAQVADVIVLLPTSVALVLFPSLVRAQDSAWSTTVRAAAVVAVVVTCACALIGAFSTMFVRVAFGAEFAEAGPALRWMLPGVVAVALATVFSQYLASIGLPKLLAGVWLVGVCLVLALGAALIPEYGASGAAAATSAAYIVILMLLLLLCLHYRRRSTDAAWPTPAIRGLVD